MPSNLVVGTLNANYTSGGVTVGFGGLIDDLSVSRAVPATDSTTTVRLLFNDPVALGTQKNSISTVHPVSGTDSFIETFSVAHGPYEITAGHGSGSTGLLTVHVLIL
jgi:hypothetical protein